MINLSLAVGVPFVMKLVALVWVFVSIALILLILIQKGRGGGIGAAFGGGGAGSLLGTKTGDFLTWVTICLVVMFLLLAVLMAKFYRPKVSEDLEVVQPPQTAQPVEMPAETAEPEAVEVEVPAEIETGEETDATPTSP